jgi:predicted dehydrogenase
MPDDTFDGFQWPSFRPPLETYRLDYGIGIVGYANIVRAQQLPAYRLAGFRVVAASDRKPERRELAKLDGIPHIYEDYREVLRRDDVDIIDCAVDHFDSVAI